MPLGSISNETRVNIYNRTKPQKKIKEKNWKKQVLTGRPDLGVVQEKEERKKNFTSCRQGISGNSLTELLTGNRPREKRKTPVKVPPKNGQNKVWGFYKKIQRGNTSKIEGSNYQNDRNKNERAKIAKSQPKLNRQKAYISTSEIPRNRERNPKKILKQNIQYLSLIHI